MSRAEVLSSGLIGAQIRLNLKIWYVRVGSVPGFWRVVRGIPAETPVCVPVNIRPVLLITWETPAGGLLLFWTVIMGLGRTGGRSIYFLECVRRVSLRRYRYVVHPF